MKCPICNTPLEFDIIGKMKKSNGSKGTQCALVCPNECFMTDYYFQPTLMLKMEFGVDIKKEHGAETIAERIRRVRDEIDRCR